MPQIDEITVQQLSRLVGLPDAPRLVDVRAAALSPCNSRILPTARRLDTRDIHRWGPTYRGKRVVVYCEEGGALSRGAAAWLRDDGVSSETLAGGFAAWAEARQPLVRPERVPTRDERGSTVWVTRARPKIVRIACPWLIRRFIDPDARFLFVAASDVEVVAKRFNATPFDTGHGPWVDRGGLCTFDVMVAEFGLETEPLLHLAKIVRGADTDRLDLSPQCGGLLAASLGFSRMYRDDVAQLDAAMALYDAFYRWCRDATGETHG
jgi:rhodanese-related sulfurtransferase